MRYFVVNKFGVPNDKPFKTREEAKKFIGKDVDYYSIQELEDNEELI